MGLFQKEIQLVEKPKHNDTTSNINIQYLNVYDAIREILDEHNTLTVKQCRGK